MKPKKFSQTKVKGGKVYYKDRVAVLVSYGFGAGWSTWNQEVNCLFTPEAVKQVMDGTATEESLQKVYAPERIYAGGLDGLTVEWLPVGTKFRITEYDGSEGIQIMDEVRWQTA